MVSLFSSLQASSYSLSALNDALNVVQENVSNVNTPGYASQRLALQSLPFQQQYGDAGGVTTAQIQTTRDELAEGRVRVQQSNVGFSSQSANDLPALAAQFPINGSSGVPAAITGFFTAVSQWSLTPNDTSSRQAVLDKASGVASGFQSVSAGLQSASAQSDQALTVSVQTINSLAAKIQALNVSRQQTGGAAPDAGADAALHSDLTQLASIANITVLNQPDGSVTVLLGGQTALVAGSHAHPVQLSTGNASDRILSDTGKDITATLTSGSLGSQLQTRNQTIPGYSSKLDAVAKSFADQVNTVLAGGVDATGAAVTAPLFTYNAGGSAAATLAVNPLQPSQLGGALAGAPGGNGNILQLSSIENANTLNGNSFAGNLGQLAAQAGQDVSAAQEDSTTQQGLLQSATQLRDQVSGVSLDEEAARMVELQRGYEAAAKMINVLDSLTQSVIDTLVPQAG